MPTQTETGVAVDPKLEAELAALIVSELNLDADPASIAPEQPLYGDGLGLDSIDILEIALVIDRVYGIKIKADSEDNFRIFASLRSLAGFVAAQRVR